MPALGPIVSVAIQELPSILALIRQRHADAHPDATLTDEQVLAGLASAIMSSLAKDDAWLAAHPPQS